MPSRRGTSLHLKVKNIRENLVLLPGWDQFNTSGCHRLHNEGKECNYAIITGVSVARAGLLASSATDRRTARPFREIFLTDELTRFNAIGESHGG